MKNAVTNRHIVVTIDRDKTSARTGSVGRTSTIGGEAGLLVSYSDFDVFGIAETNANWSVLSASAQFHECIRNTWDKTHASSRYFRFV